MRSFAAAVVLISALLAGAAGCGDFEPGVTLVLSLDLDAAEAGGRIPKGTDHARLLKDTIAVVSRRLAKLQIDHRVEVVGNDRFHVLLSGDATEADLDAAVRATTALGRLDFRIQVLPTNLYRPPGPGESAPRLEDPKRAPWPGDAEAFQAFKQAEIERWRGAEAEGRAYVPSDPKFRLCKEHGSDEFVLLEAPADESERFGGHILENPAMSREPHAGMPVVLYDVKPPYQAAFEKWTGANVGLPMAIVLNDRVRTAPVIHEALSDSVQITLGRGNRLEMEREAEDLATVLQTGALRVAPRLVEVIRKTPK